MNESFNIKRFNALFLRYWAEQKKVLLLTSLLFALVMMAIFMYNQYPSNNLGTREVWSLIGGILFFIFVATQMKLAFKELINRRKGAQFLLIPSTALEKFLFLFLVGFLLPVLMYLSATYLLDNFIIWIMGVEIPDYFWSEKYSWLAVKNFHLVFFIYLLWFTGFFVFQKSHLLLSTVSFSIFVFLLVILENLITKIYTNNSYVFSVSPFYNLNITVYTSQIRIENGLLIEYLLYSMAFMVLFAIVTFVANFFKLKEKEVKY